MDAIKTLADAQLGRLNRAALGKELKALPAALQPDERVDLLAQAKGMSGAGVLALTDRRLLFVDCGAFGKTRQIDAPFARITTVEHEEGFANGALAVTLMGERIAFEQIVPKGRATELATALRARVGTPTAATPAPDVLGQLAQLSALHDAGVVTDDEFAAKKAALLARL